MPQFPSTSSASGIWTLKKQKRARQGSNWPPLNGVDPQFNYVTMLLPGNGTNGAQNNTFLDSSTNNFSVTRNGNTTQGTFSPYGSNWSNSSFSGSNYLTYNPGASAAFGTGDFTVEAWVFATDALSSGDNPYICDTRGGGGAWSLSWNYSGGSNPWQLAWANGSLLQSSTAMNINTWNHCAYVRSGTNGTLYLNGVSIGTWTDNYNYSASVTSLTIGRRYTTTGITQWLPGYLSNFRIVKGTAVYTSAFTPPTAPLTAITNTVLLTCQSNRFIDNSSSAYAITVNGSPSVQRFSPFNPTAPYSAATIGGSGYFDGSGDYLSAPSNAAFNFGTGAFTIEAWVYLSTVANNASVILNSSYNGNNGDWIVRVGAGALAGKWEFTTWWGGVNYSASSNSAAVGGTWTHLAAVRSGNTFTLYVNGVAQTTTATNTNSVGSSSLSTLICGDNTSGVLLNGYVNDVRVVKGTAVYTSNFTPTTAPLTAITNTSLLLNFTNGGIIDNAMMNDLETVGNAQISTSVSKFGGGSMAFDGTGDWLLSQSSPENALGSVFTVECWVYINASGVIHWICGNNTGSGNTAFVLEIEADRTVYGGGWTNGTQTTATVALSTWTHIALVGDGTNYKIYLNGTQSGTAGAVNNITSTLPIYVGAMPNGTRNLNGYIDDLRITKGYARYTANFTPPAAPFPDQ